MREFLDKEPPIEDRKQMKKQWDTEMAQLLERFTKYEGLHKPMTYIKNGLGCWYTCLLYPGMEPTNNLGEQAMREHVIMRKVIGTFRSEKRALHRVTKQIRLIYYMESAILDFEKDVVRGDHVLINYTIFCGNKMVESTIEDEARQGGIYRLGKQYKAWWSIAGAGRFLRGIEEALIGMREREEKLIYLPPEKGYPDKKSTGVMVDL